MLRAAPVRFTQTVGVAPGTTTVNLGLANVRVADPYQRDWWSLRSPGFTCFNGLGAIDTSAKIRWDIIATVGGGALLIATMTSLIASAIGQLTKR